MNFQKKYHWDPFLQTFFNLQLNIIDYIFVVFFILYAYWGFKKKFFGQFFPILGIVLGFLIAHHYYNALNAYFFQLFISDNNNIVLWKQFYVTHVLSFIFLFILVNFVTNQLNHFFLRACQILYLNWLNSFLGIILGLFKAYFLIYAFMYLFYMFNISFLKNKLDFSIIRYWMLELSFKDKILYVNKFFYKIKVLFF